jgi:glycosyltransferase involved in cell wall biosynthesis
MNCRILYIVGQLGAGGLERQLCYLLQTLDRDRYRPELVVWRYSEGDVYNGVVRELGIPLHRFDSHASAAEKMFRLRRLVRVLKPELVHSFSFHTNFASWWSVLGTSTLALGAVRSDFDRTTRQSGFVLGRLSARWPRQQIFNSHAAARSARDTRTFFVAEGLHIVPNGVDLQRFRYVPLSLRSTPRILAVGSLRPVKRWDRLLRAASKLKAKGLDFEVEIVGDGPLRGKLCEQIRTLGISDYVRLLGYRSDVADLLAQASILAHTSDSEGCPNVVLEAMASGRAVIATDSGDVPSLVENESTGFVVSCKDEAGLVDRIATMITSPELCTRMGKAARLKAERELSLDRFVTQTLDVYRSIGWRARN